jgi:actin-related protein
MASNSNEVQEDKKLTHTFGNAALAAKDNHELFYPITRGIIHDWNYMELIWSYIFEELNLETKNINVLMTDSPFNTKDKR